MTRKTIREKQKARSFQDYVAFKLGNGIMPPADEIARFLAEHGHKQAAAVARRRVKKPVEPSAPNRYDRFAPEPVAVIPKGAKGNLLDHAPLLRRSNSRLVCGND